MALFIRFFILSAVIFSSGFAQAEYRVFVLKIEDATTGQARTVMTTLDHLQYAEYNPVRSSEKVSIQETWMCRRRSDRSQDIEQKYCPNPKASQSNPANIAAPKA